MIMVLLAICSGLFSQMQTVQLNDKKLQFDDGRELPAEKAFIITGEAADMIAMIKMQISMGDFKRSKNLYEVSWKRNENDNSSVAILPNHYKLRSGNEYSFQFLYYVKMKETEHRQIVRMLENTAKALLVSNIKIDDDKVRLLVSHSDLFYSLNDIIEDGMVNYETRSGISSPVFSGVVENMLRTLTKVKIKEEQTDASSVPIVASLINQVNSEIEMIANDYQYVLRESLIIPDYPVERKQNTLALNIGYAGVYNSGSFSDLDYVSGPYAGVSFPLGNRVFSGRFWNNSSISAGVFLKNFKISDTIEASGPVIDRPLYAAFGYKIFKFLKLHAGAVVLEENMKMNTSKSVYLKPFVGLSLEVNLWLGMGQK